jgi:hypothetical protein
MLSCKIRKGRIEVLARRAKVKVTSTLLTSTHFFKKDVFAFSNHFQKASA